MRGGLSAFIAGLGEVEFMSLRKPYRSVDEQLRILRSRGMAVDAGAGHVLRREGYYPIVNGYKDLFLDRKACLTAGDDRYGTGARFDDLYALFLFDRELRELLFSAITRAEAALKAVCAHDERCYCVRYDGRANENVYQAIGDLGYLLDKDDYLELFGRFSALVARATSAMPSRRQAILSAMGVRERELADRAEIILRSWPFLPLGRWRRRRLWTMSQLIWTVCNRPVGFGMDLGCHWRLGRLYGPRIVLSIVRHGDVLPGECFCTTHAEHHETTGGIALFRAGRRRR